VPATRHAIRALSSNTVARVPWRVCTSCAAQVLLVFVFLPSLLTHADLPHTPLPSTPYAPAALLFSALVYGSQHLRFRGEWLLCAAFGLGLGAMTQYTFGGGLLPALAAACLFAALRHAWRTGLDVRRFHNQ
jgi:4-amino-4-deoxy-L-arabinose transferase-like glycosyltransferase